MLSLSHTHTHTHLIWCQGQPSPTPPMSPREIPRSPTPPASPPRAPSSAAMGGTSSLRADASCCCRPTSTIVAVFLVQISSSLFLLICLRVVQHFFWNGHHTYLLPGSLTFVDWVVQVVLVFLESSNTHMKVKKRNKIISKNDNLLGSTYMLCYEERNNVYRKYKLLAKCR
jgi:hypothetical protein